MYDIVLALFLFGRDRPGRGSIVGFAVILPFFFFWTTGDLVAEWQTGEPADYVSTAFSHDVGFWFAPWFSVVGLPIGSR